MASLDVSVHALKGSVDIWRIYDWQKAYSKAEAILRRDKACDSKILPFVSLAFVRLVVVAEP